MFAAIERDEVAYVCPAAAQAARNLQQERFLHDQINKRNKIEYQISMLQEHVPRDATIPILYILSISKLPSRENVTHFLKNVLTLH